ncbi:hypothetical protein, partial [Paracidovorax avenae]|uniref:hypothetical protein n=1 Tax=Paracidovorax avenae TaxID=80867 RepID=UPI001F368E99
CKCVYREVIWASYLRFRCCTSGLRPPVFYSAEGGQSSAMASGVRLLSFDELLCVEVDGVYEHDKEPQSIEEIRKYGNCYAIGKDVEIFEM